MSQNNHARSGGRQASALIVPLLAVFLLSPPADAGHLGHEIPGSQKNLGSAGKVSLARDAFGKTVVVWEDSGNIFLRRYDERGTVLGASTTQVNVFPAASPAESAIAMNPSGQFVIAWRRGNANDIAYRIFSPAGAALGGESFANTDKTKGDHHRPAVSIGPSGAFVIAWQRADTQDTTTAWTVLVRAFTAEGAPLFNEVALAPLSETPDNPPAPMPAVAVRPDGSFVLVWVSAEATSSGIKRAIIGQRFQSNGLPVETLPADREFPVHGRASSRGNENNPAIVMNQAGDIVVVWQVTSGITGRRFAWRESNFEALNEFTAGLAGSLPAVAMDAIGRFAVTYIEGSKPRFRYFAPDAQFMSAEKIVDEDSVTDFAGSAIALDADGDLALGLWTTAGGQLRHFQGPEHVSLTVSQTDNRDPVEGTAGEVHWYAVTLRNSRAPDARFSTEPLRSAFGAASGIDLEMGVGPSAPGGTYTIQGTQGNEWTCTSLPAASTICAYANTLPPGDETELRLEVAPSGDITSDALISSAGEITLHQMLPAQSIAVPSEATHVCPAASPDRVVNVPAGPHTVDEPDELLTVALTREKSAILCPVRVDFTTADLTAKAASGDYLPAQGQLQWGLGQFGERSLTLTVKTDDLDEDNESFSLVLSSEDGVQFKEPNSSLQKTLTHTITIVDHDPLPTASISGPNTVAKPTEDAHVTLSVLLNKASGRTVSVALATESNGGGFTVTPAKELSIAAGSTNGSITVRVAKDTPVGTRLKVTLQADNALGTPTSHTLTVVDVPSKSSPRRRNGGALDWLTLALLLPAALLQRRRH